MTVFEFVFALYSVIISLGLTHLLSGLVDLRRAARVRFSLPHACWATSALLITIGNWATMWELRVVEDWPAWMVLLMLATALGQYLFCSFVTPDTVVAGDVDLGHFHEEERKRYIGAALGLLAISFVFNFSFGASGHYESWLRDVIITTPAAVVQLAGFFVAAPWVQRLVGPAMVAISIWFIVLATALSV